MSTWDKRWQLKQAEETPAPDPWLLQQQHLLGTGSAWDLAAGRGRNSLLLAAAGYRVLALDSSATALALLQSAAAQKGLQIEVLLHNLETGLPPRPQSTELILCFYYLQRDLFPAIKAKISPGGLFIGRSFCEREAPPQTSEIIYTPGELALYFSDWEILAYEEGREPASRGGTLAGIVARKPLM